MKKDLLLITNSNNDKGSKYYLNQIKRQWRESFKDSINLIEYHVDSQEVLEEVMLQHHKAKVLLLTPTDLYIPFHMEHRNIERNQTANYVVESVLKESEGFKSIAEVLIVGKGRVGREIFNQLCLKHGYCVTMYGSQFEPKNVSPSYGGNFDIIINATSQNCETNLNVEYTTIYDISGNFKSKHPNNIISMKQIGQATTRMMLEDVVKGV